MISPEQNKDFEKRYCDQINIYRDFINKYTISDAGKITKNLRNLDIIQYLLIIGIPILIIIVDNLTNQLVNYSPFITLIIGIPIYLGNKYKKELNISKEKIIVLVTLNNMTHEIIFLSNNNELLKKETRANIEKELNDIWEKIQHDFL